MEKGRHISNRLLCTVCLVIFVGLNGCAARQLDFSLKYDWNNSATKFEPLSVVIGVDDFVDLRPQTRGSDNQKWYGLIPGILWLEIASDLPEIYTAFSPFNARPFHRTIAEAVSKALHDTDVSDQIIFMPEDPYRKVEYRVEGVLRRSHVSERAYYYGSTLYVWAFRVLGFPYVTYDISLEADMRIRSLATDEVIWEGKIEGARQDKYRNVYRVARGRDGKHLIAHNFTEILSQDLVRLLPEMRNAIEKAKLKTSDSAKL